MRLNMKMCFPVCSCVLDCPYPTQLPLNVMLYGPAAFCRFCDRDERMRALTAQMRVAAMAGSVYMTQEAA